MARVPHASTEDIDAEYRDLVVSTLQEGERLNVYTAIANNQPVLAGLRGFLSALWTDSGLTDRERELVILSVAAELGSTYEWHQHETIATNAGLTRGEIAAVGRDDRSSFTPAEQGLMAYARAVVRGRVEDPLHEALADHFDSGQIVGVAATAAGYAALHFVIDALDVELEGSETFVGWDLT